MDMADKYQNRYRIPSARAYWWDYRRSGAYFITICTHGRVPFFGAVQSGVVQLSDAGQLAEATWQLIPQQFDFTALGAYVIMPDHMHGIIIIQASAQTEADEAGVHHGENSTGGITGRDNPMLHQNLSHIIRWYKGRTTFRCRQQTPEFRWQARFHDHIIRDADEFARIAGYIRTNPDRYGG